MCSQNGVFGGFFSRNTRGAISTGSDLGLGETVLHHEAINAAHHKRVPRSPLHHCHRPEIPKGARYWAYGVSPGGLNPEARATLHRPPILPPNLIQRITDLPQRTTRVPHFALPHCLG